jgi:hypothetical protein
VLLWSLIAGGSPLAAVFVLLPDIGSFVHFFNDIL